MTLTEHRGNVFEVRGLDVHFTHCIASDLCMGAGIAVDFQHRFGLRGKLLDSGEPLASPTCVLVGKVFCLITKRRSCGKPTIQSMRMAVRRMAEIVAERGILRIAMPRIGCGLDRLGWAEVRAVLMEELGGTGVAVEVYRL